MNEFIVEFTNGVPIIDVKNIFIKMPAFKYNFESSDFITILWGDPIIERDLNYTLNTLDKPEKIINEICGHYYYFIFNKNTKEIWFGNSIFSILPIYYFKDDNRIILASSPLLICKYVNHTFELSRLYIIEKLLFNYPFTSGSIYNEINILRPNAYFKISNNEFLEVVHTDIINWFNSSENNDIGNLIELSEMFVERTKHYLPESYFVSFTGGFDGRTLLALSLFYRKNITAFSFGIKNSEDILIPINQAKILGIPYRSYLLDQQSYIEQALFYGREFTNNSNGDGNWARAHYLYASSDISKHSDYIVTGNFGSEIFRSFHNPGVMVSPLLYDMIRSDNLSRVIEDLDKRAELSFIPIDSYREEIQILKHNLTNYFKGLSHLSKNQILYKFILDEVFRKYFGAEIKAEGVYLSNRTPFLDPKFVKNLYKSGFGGVNSEFFENNPIKRFKGQLIYAYILRQTNQKLFKMLTSKGYSPSDLLKPIGKMRIAQSYLTRKLRIIKETEDPFGIQSVYLANKSAIQIEKFNDQYFLSKKLQLQLSSASDFDNTLINYISLNWFINEKLCH